MIIRPMAGCVRVTVMEDEKIQQPKPRKKKSWVKVLLITTCAILSVVLILLCCAWWYLDHLLNQIEYVVDDGATMSSQEAEDAQTEGAETMDPTEDLPHIDDITISTNPSVPSDEVKEPKGDIINILLIGQDRRPGEGRARSDSMILVTFNRSNNTITMTSFMRDSYVTIPGYKPYKLNSAYQNGGMSLLNETLYVNYGVEVDGNVVVDFGQFEKVIDTLGGVDISLTKAEANFLNNKYGWSLSPGSRRLNGKEALAYSRIRYIDNDYKRAGRQRKVLMSLIDRYKSLSTVDMISKLESVLGLVATDIEKREIMSLATELFPMFSNSKFETAQIPAEGTFRGGDVQIRPGLKDWFQYDIDFAANREILREIFDTD